MCQSIVKKIAVKFKQSNKNCSLGRGKTLKILPDYGSAVHRALHQRDPLTHVYSTRSRVLSLHNFLAAASSMKCFWVTEGVNEMQVEGVRHLQQTDNCSILPWRPVNPRLLQHNERSVQAHQLHGTSHHWGSKKCLPFLEPDPLLTIMRHLERKY